MKGPNYIRIVGHTALHGKVCQIMLYGQLLGTEGKGPALSLSSNEKEKKKRENIFFSP